MAEIDNPPRKSARLAARRVVLLASVAGVGAALLFAGPNGFWQLPPIPRRSKSRSSIPPASPTLSPK
jgi:hypothetical protein